MLYNFNNSVLIVVFNYSNCVRNKDILKSLYEKHFKMIVFYSDVPAIIEDCDEEVNYVSILQGYNTCNIFKHFYEKYGNMIEKSDGIFYTMDDNIINVNILNTYKNDKIIYFHNELCSYEEKKEEQWFTPYGREAVKRLIEDPDFYQYNIQYFSGGDGYVGFSDFFYLPKKYLTDTFFNMCNIFAKHRVFLEIAIPSILNNLEKDRNEYQSFTYYNAWPNRDFFTHKDNIYHCVNKEHHLFIHPIKFNQNPESKSWLKDIFCKDKCVIITTINKPTETVIKHIQQNKNYDVIVVGDHKTPDDYNGVRCIYLDIPAQKKLFPLLCDVIPYNHYCRKNLGYLYAVKKGYQIIYETDDDNIPHDNFDHLALTNKDDSLTMITEEKNSWINIFKYFTFNAYIWPRGYPLSLIKSKPSFSIKKTNVKPSIINGLVENDPDVDALFRIICNHQESIHWEKNKKIVIDNSNVCVFNTQNTFWVDQSLFVCLLIPSSVSFRYCDILRGIINNIVLKRTGKYMMYTSPNVVQLRNEHNLISDFKSEYEMYIHNENILDFIENDIENGDTKNIISSIYKNLLEKNVIKSLDIIILEQWLAYF